jgi:Tat protein secretion system quality control protein TatD with DNase activity
MVLFAAAPLLASLARGDEPDTTARFAAIAYSESTGRCGDGRGFSDLEEAKAEAVRQCHAEDAKVVTWARNAWCSLAVGDNHHVHASHWGHTQAEAQDQAIATLSRATGVYILVSVFAGNNHEPSLMRQPPTPKEEKMFQEMYGEAGLDADTLQTVRESWAIAKRSERKTQYDEFMAQVKEAVDAVTPVNIRIVNPAEYQVAWGYLINGEAQNLPSGSTQELTLRSTIRFDRGGDGGAAEYRLDEGVYKFTKDENGKWDLIQQATSPSGLAADDAGSEPVTPEQQKMFQEMYAQAGLDAESLKAVEDGWKKATGAERKTQYDEFMARVKEAVDAATPVNIRIVNPAEYQVAWGYLIDGEAKTLPSGSTQELTRKAVIRFDRGGDAGAAEYSLDQGVYTFTKDKGGKWDLVQEAEPDPSKLATSEPITPEQQKMFQEMYGQAGLDAESLKAVEDGWKAASGAERKTQYEQFMAQVKEAVEAATPVSIHIVNPAQNEVAWSFLLDEEVQTLAAGASKDLQKKCTLKFDRGDGKGEAEYTLVDGTYTFGPAAGGGWELSHTSAADQAVAAAKAGPSQDPVTPEQKKMFEDMYGQVQLDAESRRAVEDGWKSASSAERKAQYEEFMAKVREAVAAVEKKGPDSNR